LKQAVASGGELPKQAQKQTQEKVEGAFESYIADFVAGNDSLTPDLEVAYLKAVQINGKALGVDPDIDAELKHLNAAGSARVALRKAQST
jgi:hypothetical protein